MSSNEQSHQALSDPLPRLYSCFCDKFFTTYPGIYLHLKSKHSNLFQKYKKLKITKLFKKVKDQKGNQLYKLDKLSDNISSNAYLYQKKTKQNNLKKNHNKISENEMRNRDQIYFNKNFMANNFNNGYKPFQGNFNQNYHIKNLSENKQYYQKNGNFQTPFFSPNYYNYIYPQSFNQFSPFFNPFFDQMNNHVNQFTIKKLFQQYLSMAAQKKVQQFLLIKNSLYDLMVFIDKNYQIANDPRTNAKPFIFSYCDQFEPRYLGPLMLEYLNHFKYKLLEESEDLTLAQKIQKQGQLKHVGKFIKWLKQMNFIQNIGQIIFIEHDFNIEKKQSIQSVNKKEQKQEDNEHSNYKMSSEHPFNKEESQ